MPGKFILLVLSWFLFMPVAAQNQPNMNFAGKWSGELVQKVLYDDFEFRLELNIVKFDWKVSGTSRIETKSGHDYALFSIAGNIDGNKIFIEETGILSQHMSSPTIQWVQKKMHMELFGTSVMRGTWEDKYNTVSGTVDLHK